MSMKVTGPLSLISSFFKSCAAGVAKFFSPQKVPEGRPSVSAGSITHITINEPSAIDLSQLNLVTKNAKGKLGVFNYLTHRREIEEGAEAVLSRHGLWGVATSPLSVRNRYRLASLLERGFVNADQAYLFLSDPTKRSGLELLFSVVNALQDKTGTWTRGLVQPDKEADFSDVVKRLAGAVLGRLLQGQPEGSSVEPVLLKLNAALTPAGRNVLFNAVSGTRSHKGALRYILYHDDNAGLAKGVTGTMRGFSVMGKKAYDKYAGEPAAIAL